MVKTILTALAIYTNKLLVLLVFTNNLQIFYFSFGILKGCFQ